MQSKVKRMIYFGHKHIVIVHWEYFMASNPFSDLHIMEVARWDLIVIMKV